MDSEQLLKYQSGEDLLSEESNRYVILPLNPKYIDIWELYKTHENAFWKAEEN